MLESKLAIETGSAPLYASSVWVSTYSKQDFLRQKVNMLNFVISTFESSPQCHFANVSLAGISHVAKLTVKDEEEQSAYRVSKGK